jgi:hypothetical protein
VLLCHRWGRERTGHLGQAEVWGGDCCLLHFVLIKLWGPPRLQTEPWTAAVHSQINQGTETPQDLPTRGSQIHNPPSTEEEEGDRATSKGRSPPSAVFHARWRRGSWAMEGWWLFPRVTVLWAVAEFQVPS